MSVRSTIDPLVEYERINRQAGPVGPSVLEEPPVHGRRFDFVAFEGGGNRHELAMATPHRFLEARGGLAGRRDESDAIGCGEIELGEQGHDRGRDGGLAGTGAARYHTESAGGGGPGGLAYRIVGRCVRKEPIERHIEPRRFDSGRAGEPPQAGGDPLLRRPQPLEIETVPGHRGPGDTPSGSAEPLTTGLATRASIQRAGAGSCTPPVPGHCRPAIPGSEIHA